LALTVDPGLIVCSRSRRTLESGCTVIVLGLLAGVMGRGRRRAPVTRVAPGRHHRRHIVKFIPTCPGPSGQEDGLIGTIDDEVTEVATDIRNTVDPSAQHSSTPTSVDVAGGDEQTTDEADTETPPAPQPPEKDPDGDGNEKEDDTENLAGDTKVPRGWNIRRPRTAPVRQAKPPWSPARVRRRWCGCRLG
jgi:hypothetical protein